MAPNKADEVARPFEIWTLPDVLLYQISEFVTPKTERASFFCHKLAPLNKASCKAILEEDKSVALWGLVLSGDYGAGSRMHRKRERASKRLKRNPIEQVREAHNTLKRNTEIAHYYLVEHCNSSSKSKCLTRGRLVGIIETYGPNLMFNKSISSGGTFLVEVCRAKNVPKATILLCVKELVEKRGALVDQKTGEAANSSLTAISVAAVRGLPNVVKYLLAKGANPNIKCSGRFLLSTNKRKSLRCIGTAGQFAQRMLDAEQAEGANNQDLRDLKQCVKLLSS